MYVCVCPFLMPMHACMLAYTSPVSNPHRHIPSHGIPATGTIGRVTAVEMAWAAEQLVEGCLLEGLAHVEVQARGLVQVGGFGRMDAHMSVWRFVGSLRPNGPSVCVSHTLLPSSPPMRVDL